MGTSNAYSDTTPTTNPNVTVINGEVVFYSNVDGKLVKFTASAKDNKLVITSGDESLPVDNRWLHTSIAPDILAAQVSLTPDQANNVPFSDIVSALGL